MEDIKNTPQVGGTTSEANDGSTVQISDSMLNQAYTSIDIAKEIFELSINNGWTKKQLFQALKIIQSLK